MCIVHMYKGWYGGPEFFFPEEGGPYLTEEDHQTDRARQIRREIETAASSTRALQAGRGKSAVLIQTLERNQEDTFIPNQLIKL